MFGVDQSNSGSGGAQESRLPARDSGFKFTWRGADERLTESVNVHEALGIPREQDQRVLMINPHDDDCLLGAGLTVQALAASGVKVYSAIATDGRMGYTTHELRDTIADVRRHETNLGYGRLGIAPECIFRFDYPDAQMHLYQGRRRARPDDPDVQVGHSGLLNSLVRAMRLVRPAAVFINTPTDTHPDHKIVAGEAAWAAALAPGNIWPELGAGFPQPVVWEYMVYAAFAGVPTLKVEGHAGALAAKMEAIQAFASQGDIGGLLTAIGNNGPVEYFRRLDSARADLNEYAQLFMPSRSY